MAMDQSERDKRRREKAAKVKEEDLMIHHLHTQGPERAVFFLTPPRHKYEVSQSVALEFARKSMLTLLQDLGDEFISPC